MSLLRDSFDNLKAMPSWLFKLFTKVVTRVSYPLRAVTAAKTIKDIRTILYLYYKYEIPYSPELEQQVISAFKMAEGDLANNTSSLVLQRQELVDRVFGTRRGLSSTFTDTLREARIAVHQLFARFDPLDITPSHGPGAVATKQKQWDKFLWSNIAKRLSDFYPLDAYFCASMGDVCDSYKAFGSIGDEDLPARVILVPKDSRGPRLISAEPVDFQWIQQGLSRSIVRVVERHPLTKGRVNFTKQDYNRHLALVASYDGELATLDLKEASDRVHLELVRALFPESLVKALEACRSSATRLPDGTVLPLLKFAPMGSALCFPIMAVTIWSLLYGSTRDSQIRKNLFVYGDDVIVPSSFAEHAMATLEAFGLLINRNKSCYQGFFRESCGVDAFLGENVTPVRLRTVWNHRRSPSVYTSWIAYANSFYDIGWCNAYDYVVSSLESIYRLIPGEDLQLAVPSLRWSQATAKSFKRRWNPNLQRLELHVLGVRSPTVKRTIHGWSMLLRYFTEASSQASVPWSRPNKAATNDVEAFSADKYTRRRTSKLVRHWAGVSAPNSTYSK
jgi:hypothetical protein